MYNSIYPVNINYSNHLQYRKSGENNQSSNVAGEKSFANSNQNTFPDGTKVAIDYTKGQINISQVLTDFRSTIVAINAPEDVKDEVNIYLGLVEKEAKKENPSREIILANLKNASKVSDNYIASALKKPSDVVEKWIDTLFLQKINLKANPNEINPDFQLEFPQNAQERIEADKQERIQESQVYSQNLQEEMKISDVSEENTEEIILENKIEVSQNNYEDTQNDDVLNVQTPFSPLCVADIKARDLFVQAKNMPNTNQGDIEALNLLNDALGVVANEENVNENIKAAIHMERGKIFDSYDYVDYALRDYFEATKANDLNLKAQAFYKSGQIYDEFSEFYPALDNYLSSIAYSGEAENLTAQTTVLSKVAGLYTKKYDKENAFEYGDLAIETAQDTQNSQLIAKTYSIDAQNSQHLGENERALNSYKNALSVFSRDNESYEQMAYNYEQASIVMRKLGNIAKAEKLLLKANQYYQKAQHDQYQLGEAS